MCTSGAPDATHHPPSNRLSSSRATRGEASAADLGEVPDADAEAWFAGSDGPADLGGSDDDVDKLDDMEEDIFGDLADEEAPADDVEGVLDDELGCGLGPALEIASGAGSLEVPVEQAARPEALGFPSSSGASSAAPAGPPVDGSGAGAGVGAGARAPSVASGHAPRVRSQLRISVPNGKITLFMKRPQV